MIKKSSNTRPISLQHLLSGIVTESLPFDIPITGIAADSRQISPGDLFICLIPSAEKSAVFVKEAIQKGALAVLQEVGHDPCTFKVHTKGSEQVLIGSLPHLRNHYGQIAARFFQNPGQSLHMIGVTGTNGKTSCTHCLADACGHLGASCGLIGTLGHGWIGHITPHALTTPDAVTLQKILADLKARSARFVAMEVSSHSLVQKRVASIAFQTAIFTNLTHDHLDYHPSMAAYGAAKRLLFLNKGIKQAIINADDPFGRELILSFKNRYPCYAYTLDSRAVPGVPTLSAQNLQFSQAGTQAHITAPWGSGMLETPFLGKFNLSNLLAVCTTLCVLGFPFKQVIQVLACLQAVPGRMQALKTKKGVCVVVDYAHTPDALSKVLTAVKPHTKGKLWCVFGCGGNRDSKKRAKMGHIAERVADRVILTDDNPRDEMPRPIIDDILQGFKKPVQAMVIPDRRKAIIHAVTQAKAGDRVVIAGKGHENYQEIGGVRIDFSDVAVVQLATRCV